MLRLRAARSPLTELAKGSFQRIIADPDPPRNPAKALLCSGKLYYELVSYREAEKQRNVTIHRIEQFYPFQPDLMKAVLKPLPDGAPVVWVQEEPVNMGACAFLRLRLGKTLLGKHPFSVVARPESASPASGSATAHKLEQKRLLAAAFGKETRAKSKPERGKERKHGR